MKTISSINGAGVYEADGLPNITGDIGYRVTSDVAYHDTVNGAFTHRIDSRKALQWSSGSTSTSHPLIYFDASKSNNIYGNSQSVTPKNISFMIGVYAVGAIVPVGTTDAEKIMSGVTRVEGLLNSKIDKISVKSYVIEHYQNGTNWYRVYSDGWIEQGGRITNTTSSGTVTFAKPFSNTNYTCTTVEGGVATAETVGTDTAGYGDNMGITAYTPSSFRYSCTAGRYFNYYACGY